MVLTNWTYKPNQKHVGVIKGLICGLYIQVVLLATNLQVILNPKP